jgi:thioredoxin 1
LTAIALTRRNGIPTFTLRAAADSAAPHLKFTRNIMAVGKVSDADFENEVLKAQGPVVVDFWAEWCGPCRMIAPALDEIAGAMGDKVKIVKLNVDENPQTASKYGVMSIPTLMIFKGGEMASRQVGAAPKQKLQQWITSAV